MSTAGDDATSTLEVDRGQTEKRWDAPILNIGQDGPLDHPLPEYYFTCPPERKYIFSKAHVEGNGIEYKPRPLELDENGDLPHRVHKLSDNDSTWTEANNLRQLYAMQVAQVKKRPETYEDLYDYFDGHDLYKIGAYNAFNLISTLADQNKILDPFIQRDKKKVMESFLDEWLAKNPEAEGRLLSWNWQRDSSARVVLDGYDIFPELGYLTDDDKLIFSAIIAKRYETVKAARAARSARLNPIVVNGSGDGNFGNRSASQSSNGRGTLRRNNDLSNANTSIPLPATTAGPISSAFSKAQVPMVTAAAPVSASRYIFNGSHSVKVSGPSVSSHNRHWTDTKHPSATNLSPQAFRTRQGLRYENKQMARGLPTGKPEGIPSNGQSPSRKLTAKPGRNGVHNGGAQYHGGYNPDTTPTKPSRHALMRSPQGAMVSNNPFGGRGHAGFNNNQPGIPYDLPQPGFLHQPAGHQGGIGRDISIIGGSMLGHSPSQGPRTTGFHGDVHSRAVSNYQQISPPRNQMSGQLQQTTPTTRFASSQRRASGSGPSTKNGPRANGAGWALSEQQDSIHGPKFVHNKTKGDTSGGPKPRRNSTMSVPSPGARNQQALNSKPAATAATAAEDTKPPSKHGNGGNGYVKPPPQTRETCLNYGIPNSEPAVECPCPTCTQRSRNVTVTVMGGGVLERSDEEALRKHFGQWGQIECVIFPRMPTGFYHGLQGGQSRTPNRAYITFTSDTVPPVVVEEAHGKLCPGIRGALRVVHSACSKHFRGVSPPPHRRSYGDQPVVSGPMQQHYHHQPGHPNIVAVIPPPMAPPIFANGGFSVAQLRLQPLPMPPMAPGGFDQGLPQYAQLGDSPPQTGEQWAANVTVSLPALPPRPVAPIMSAPGLCNSHGPSTPPRQVRMAYSEPDRLPGSLTSTPSPKKELERSEVKQLQQKQQEMGKKSRSSEKPHESVEAQKADNPIPSNSGGPQARQNDNKLSLPGMHRDLSVAVSEGKVTTPSLSTGNSTIIMTPPGSDKSNKGKSNDGSPQPASQLEMPTSTEENSGTVVVYRSRKSHGSIPKDWRADGSAAEPGRADGYVADSERTESSMKPPEVGQGKEGEQEKPAYKKKNKKKQKNKAQGPGKNSQDGQQGHDEQNVPAADGPAAGTDAAVVKKNATTKKHHKSGKFGKRGHVEDPTSENTTAESRAASRATTTISSGRSTPVVLNRAEETRAHKAQKKQQPRSATPESTSNKPENAVPSTAQTPEKSGKGGDDADLTVRKNRVDRGDDAVGMLTATSATPKHCGAKSTDPTSRVSPFAAQKYEIDRLNADNSRESSASTLRAASFNKSSAGLDAKSNKPHHIRSGSTLPRGFDPYPRIPTIAVPRGVAAPLSSTGDKATTGPASTKGKTTAEGGAGGTKPAIRGASSTADGAARPPQTTEPAKTTPPTTPISSPKLSSAAAVQGALPPSPPCSVKGQGQGQGLNPAAKPFTASSRAPKVAVPSDGGGGNGNNNSNNAGKRKNRKNNNKKGGAATAAAAVPTQINQPPKPEPGKDGKDGSAAAAASHKQPEPEGGDDSRVVVENIGLHEERSPPPEVQQHEHEQDQDQDQDQDQQLDDTEPEPETADYAQYHQAVAAADHAPDDDGDKTSNYLLAMGNDESESTSMPVVVDHAVQRLQQTQAQQQQHQPQRQQQQQQRGQGPVAARGGGAGDGGGGSGGGGGGGYASAAAGKPAHYQQQHKSRPSFGSAKAWPALGAESGNGSGDNNNNNNNNNRHHHHHHQRNSSRAASGGGGGGDKPARNNPNNPPTSPASSTTLSIGSGSNKSATTTATAPRGSMKGIVGGGNLRSGSPPAAATATATATGTTAAKPPVRVHSSIELSKALRDHKARIGSSSSSGGGGGKA